MVSLAASVSAHEPARSPAAPAALVPGNAPPSGAISIALAQAPTGVAVAVGVGLTVLVALAVAVVAALAVEIGVAVAPGVAVAIGVAVRVGVRVGVAVRVGVGVRVGVRVAVRVAVSVGWAVLVGRGVAVRVGPVLVTVGVAPAGGVGAITRSVNVPLSLKPSTTMKYVSPAFTVGASRDPW